VHAVQCEEARNTVTQEQSYGFDCEALSRPDEASKRGCDDCSDPDETLGHEDETSAEGSNLVVQRVQAAANAADAADNGTPSRGSTGSGGMAIQVHRIGLLWATAGDCIPSPCSRA